MVAEAKDEARNPLILDRAVARDAPVLVRAAARDALAQGRAMGKEALALEMTDDMDVLALGRVEARALAQSKAKTRKITDPLAEAIKNSPRSSCDRFKSAAQVAEDELKEGVIRSVVIQQNGAK